MPKIRKEASEKHASKRSTSLPVLIETGLRIIDQGGLEALTMRRLSDELSIGAMTVYSYFRNKEELLDCIALNVLGEIPKKIPVNGVWEDRLMNTMNQLQIALHEHPGIAAMSLSRRQPIAALDPFREAILTILHEAGFPTPDAVDALSVLVIYVMGYIIVEQARIGAQPEIETARLAQLSRQEFPHLSAAAENYATHVSKRGFDAGLKILIDGLSAELAALGVKKSRRAAAARSRFTIDR